jgi:GNAT superfamily N-acetyltransferase
MMSIRVRQQDDLGGCVSLLGTVHAADRYPLLWPADPAAWLTPANSLRAWVAEGEGGLMGHVALCSAVGDTAAPLWSAASGLPAKGLAMVARLFVAPAARGCGAGAILLTAACDEAHLRSLRPVLEVLDQNQLAIALYERTGWRRVASVPAAWVHRSDSQAALFYYLAPD